MNKIPIVAITMSEAAGIGPEILVKALAGEEIAAFCRPIAIGDAKVMRKAVESTGTNVGFNVIKKFEEAKFEPKRPDLIDLDNIPLEKLHPSHPDAITGRAMLDYTRYAVDLFLAKKIDGAIGGPHSKKAAEEAGEHFDGYPGLIAKITNSPHPYLMLVSGGLRVSNVTLHVSLRNALAMLDRALVLNCIRESDKAVKAFGIAKPRLAVAGLNPHAGEERMFGDEDEDIIKPAIADAVKEGINATGPYPADSLFYGCLTNDRFDAYIAMYHDQAHLPVKALVFKSASAMAIGVPVNWATVDHGCALDIAWKGVADPAVLIETVKLISGRAPTFRQFFK
ncbi:MAG: 4-hydroxythreonine-4-phosphate dehydrogenase PdxA [Planctomycetes bacterium]|nr:4-hydroxythreonine-4-phosphate dehydrogenase PdxA [Planctomycetota bacterium]